MWGKDLRNTTNVASIKVKYPAISTLKTLNQELRLVIQPTLLSTLVILSDLQVLSV